MLQLGFDGWGDDFNQFVEWRSADIYPIAWCELVRHPLQAPKESISIPDGKGAKRYKCGNGLVTKYTGLILKLLDAINSHLRESDRPKARRSPFKGSALSSKIIWNHKISLEL